MRQLEIRFRPPAVAPNLSGTVYDDNGNLTAMSDQAGSSTFSYDQNNRLTGRKSHPARGTTRNVAYAYHANGTLARMPTLAGQSVTYSYDNGLRLVKEPEADARLDDCYLGRSSA